jgi:nitrous oxidase accessory protein
VEENHSRHNARYGLHFMFSHHDEYRRNSFEKNGSGVAVMYTEAVVIEDNLFSESQGTASYGVLLKEIRDSKVCRNTFLSNTVGIKMEGCSRVLLNRNKLMRNGKAIDLASSSMDNRFTENEFLLNSFDIVSISESSANTLDSNYWDKYEGYDLNHDQIGDVPFRPVGLFTTVVEEIPHAIMLYRSFSQYLLDRAEKMLPSLTPENFMDRTPLMKPIQP